MKSVGKTDRRKTTKNQLEDLFQSIHEKREELIKVNDLSSFEMGKNFAYLDIYTELRKILGAS